MYCSLKFKTTKTSYKSAVGIQAHSCDRCCSWWLSPALQNNVHGSVL